MRRLAFILLAACVRIDPSTLPVTPENPVFTAPIPPADAGDAGDVTLLCAAYCEKVERCNPGASDTQCPIDCVEVLSDPELSDVSGATPTRITCYAAAPSCDVSCE